MNDFLDAFHTNEKIIKAYFRRRMCYRPYKATTRLSQRLMKTWCSILYFALLRFH